MPIIASWSGAGLVPGPVDASTAGSGDDSFDDVTAATFTVDASGLHSPRIRMDQQAATAAQLTWSATIVGALGSYAIRVYLELTGYPPSGASRIIDPRDNSNVLLWWLDVHNTGVLRLKDPAGVTVDQTAAAVPLDTELRIEAVAEPDGGGGTQVTVYVYTGDGTTPLDTLTATGLAGPFQQVRFGEPGTSPTLPTAHLDEMAVADEAVLIGPAVDPPDPPDPPDPVPVATAPQIPVFQPGVPLGDVPDVFNELIRDPLMGLLAAPIFRARRTGAYGVTETVAAYVPWDTVDEDTYTGWSAALPTRYTVPAGWSGWWSVTCAVSLSGTGATGLVLIPTCAVNGTSQIAVNSGAGWEGQEVFVPVGGSTVPKTVTSHWRVYAAAGDRIEIGLWFSNESGITAVDTTPGRECRVELIWDGV